MGLAGVGELVNRVIAWADHLQRQHWVLGFPYAVVKKYGDDEGGRAAALITYYGFLSIFPLLLLGVAVLSRILVANPQLRQRLITAIVPQALRPSIEHSVTTLPMSVIPFAVGLIGLLYAGTGVVFSACQTLNHVAAVPYRRRAGFLPRYARVFAMLVALLLGALAACTLTVVASTLPGPTAVERAAAVLGSAVVVFTVLLLGARVLLARPAPARALWPAALLGAAAVTLVLNTGTVLLTRFAARAGPVYGSFATVAGIFTVLYLVSQALVYSAEIAAVRYARLWPRALDVNRPPRPTPARSPCWPANKNGPPPPGSNSASSPAAHPSPATARQRRNLPSRPAGWLAQPALWTSARGSPAAVRASGHGLLRSERMALAIVRCRVGDRQRPEAGLAGQA